MLKENTEEFWCWVKCCMICQHSISGCQKKSPTSLLVCACLVSDWVTGHHCPSCFYYGLTVIVSSSMSTILASKEAEVASGITVMIKNIVKGITENEFYWFLCVKIIVFCIIPLLLINEIFLLSAFLRWEQIIIISIIIPKGTCFFKLQNFNCKVFFNNQCIAVPSIALGEWNSWSASKQAWTV